MDIKFGNIPQSQVADSPFPNLFSTPSPLPIP
jgi:hypothetical protein